MRAAFEKWAEGQGMNLLTVEQMQGAADGDDRFVCPNTARAFAAWSAALSRPAGGEDKPSASDHAMYLVSRCLDTNSECAEFRFDGMTDGGAEVGDWIVTVRNAKAAPTPPSGEDVRDAVDLEQFRESVELAWEYNCSRYTDYYENTDHEKYTKASDEHDRLIGIIDAAIAASREVGT